MKKFIVLGAFAVLAMAVSPVMAGLLTMDQATLLGMGKTWDSDGATSSGLTIVAEGAGVRVSSQLQYGDGTGDGFASMGVGYGWQPPAGLNNLTGYDGYTLSFLNTNNSSWFVNLYVNTGWTDAPHSEPDNFYESVWVELLPGVATQVTLDFAGVLNLNHVTNIGYQIGGNMDEYPYYNSDNPSNPDTYHIDVTPIPEPATLVLLGLGGLLVRKRS